MWCSCKGLEFFLCEMSIRDCEELLVEFLLPAEVSVAEHAIRRWGDLGCRHHREEDEQGI
jgi:hypothetical protein